MNATIFLLAVAGFCYIYYNKARDLFILMARDRLYRLRNQWFDYAMNGNISFNDAGYRALRSELHTRIRFCHKSNLLSLIIFTIFFHKEIKKEPKVGALHMIENKFGKKSKQFEEAKMIQQEASKAMFYLTLRNSFMVAIIFFALIIGALVISLFLAIMVFMSLIITMTIWHKYYNLLKKYFSKDASEEIASMIEQEANYLNKHGGRQYS